MRLVFMGTPAFAVPALRALHTAGHNIVQVYTQPPRPAGRGQQLQVSAVQAAATDLNLPVCSPTSLKAPTEIVALSALTPEAIVVVAYGLLLPPPILAIPPLGCINIHGSLLPRWRGAAPIQRALLAGDDVTGITTMLMDAGLDTGPMLETAQLPITPRCTSKSLAEDLSMMGAKLIVSTLAGLVSGHLSPMPQPKVGITIAPKLSRADGRWYWQQPAYVLERQFRALQPWPGCYFDQGGEVIKILACRLEPAATTHQAPGTIVSANGTIACGEGAIELLQVQRPNRGPCTGAEWLRGAGLSVGTKLE